jgi:hypothetical protein
MPGPTPIGLFCCYIGSIFSARPAHAGGDALHSDGEGISQNLDVGLVFIVAHAQEDIGLQHIDGVHQRHTRGDGEARILHA